MDIKTNFEIGDPLWWVSTTKQDGDLVIAQIKKQEDAIDGIQIGRDNVVKIITDGSVDPPGSQYSCLSEQQALDWVKANCPEAILLDGQTLVKVLYTDFCGQQTAVKITCNMEDIESYIRGAPIAGHMDAEGYFVIYSACSRRDGDPITTFILDGDGNPVDAMFGAFLLMRAEKGTDGTWHLVDADMLDTPQGY